MGFIEASKTGSKGGGDGVPVGALMTFSGSQLPDGYEPAKTEEQISIQQLNDNLSELTKYQFGNVVDIKSYTYDEPYVCPYDGYIWITSGYEASKYTNAKLNNTFVVSAVGNTGTGGITTCFVKKGMTVGIKTNSGNDCQAKFYPLA
jgi:hypothetical protein